MTTHPAPESERDRTSARQNDPNRHPDVPAGDPLLLTPEEAARVLRVGVASTKVVCDGLSDERASDVEAATA